MKYLSVDIETTGTNIAVDKVLEVAFVLEDTLEPKELEDLPRLHLYTIDQCNSYTVSPFTAQLHKDIWARFVDFNPLLLNEVEIFDDVTFPWRVSKILVSWLNTLGLHDWKIVFAGKNASGFDLPFLRKYCRLVELKISHRTLDPTIKFVDWEKDIEPPNLTECLRRAGMKPTNLHSAVGDALDVIRLMRETGCTN